MRFFIFSILFIFIIFSAFSQTKDIEERMSLFNIRYPYRFGIKADLFSGYNSNVNLDSEKKGDIFEEFLLSFNLRRPLYKDVDFTISYNLDLLNYNEITDASNILNNFNLTFNKKLFNFIYGVGYNFDFVYYPNNEDYSYLFNKIFFYTRQSLGKKFYHQIMFSRGYKYYPNKEAPDSLYTTLDKKRQDGRYIFDYIISKAIYNLSFRLKTRYSMNDSNVTYLDFYDYNSLTPSFELDYRLQKFLISLKFSYTIKNYERTVIFRDYKEKDRLYNLVSAFNYIINSKNSLLFEYSYTKNSSNENLNEYFEHIFKFGLRHNF